MVLVMGAGDDRLRLSIVIAAVGPLGSQRNGGSITVKTERAVEMGFGYGKVTRDSDTTVVNVGAPNKLRRRDLDDGACREEGFSIQKKLITPVRSQGA